MRKKKQGIKPIDQPDYTYWQALYMALYSRRLFIDVVKRWRGFGVGYFILLISLISIPWSIIYTEQFVRYFNDEIRYPLENMPLLTIQNGEASIDKHMPYFVKGKTGFRAIEIDTINDIKAFPKQYPTLMVLITKDKIYYRSPKIESLSKFSLSTEDAKVSTYTFDKNDNEVFSGREWVKTSKIGVIEAYASFFIYPLVIGVFLGLYSLYSIILSSIGRLIASVILKYKISFIDSFRLTWVASTAPLMMFTVLQCLGVNLYGSAPYYVAFVACYFAFAVIVVKRESQTMVRW